MLECIICRSHQIKVKPLLEAGMYVATCFSSLVLLPRHATFCTLNLKLETRSTSVMYFTLTLPKHRSLFVAV
jgi:hypothetical protein